MSTSEIPQNIFNENPEDRRQREVERRVHDIFVENDRRKLERRAVERREEKIDRRVGSRRDEDPDVEEMLARLQAQQYRKSKVGDHFHTIQLVLAFLSGIILSEIVQFYMDENILTLFMTVLENL